MDFDLDYKEIIKLFRKRLDIIIILPLIAVFTSLIYSNFLLTPVYSSYTTLIINKSENSSASMDYNTVLANQQIAKTYEQIAKSRTVMESAKEELKLNLSAQEIDNMVSVQAVENTELLKITVNDIDSKRAKLIANSVAKSFMKKINQTMNIENVKIVDPAVENNTTIKQGKTIAAFFMGLFLAIVIVVTFSYLDNTIKTKEDIQDLLDLPVIGTIPIID